MGVLGEIRTRILRCRRAALIHLSFERARPEGFEPSPTALEVRLPSTRRGRMLRGRASNPQRPVNSRADCQLSYLAKEPAPGIEPSVCGLQNRRIASNA